MTEMDASLRERLYYVTGANTNAEGTVLDEIAARFSLRRRTAVECAAALPAPPPPPF